MSQTYKFHLIIIGAVVLMLIIWITPKGPEFSNDPLIRERQKEAIELEFFEKAKEIRLNAKVLFGWSYYADTSTKNGVTFSGYNGKYAIDFKGLRVVWTDRYSLKIVYENSRVYEAGIKVGLDSIQRLGRVKAYLPGEWISVFDEMYKQAIKGLPDEAPDELKDNWGLTN